MNPFTYHAFRVMQLVALAKIADQMQCVASDVQPTIMCDNQHEEMSRQHLLQCEGALARISEFLDSRHLTELKLARAAYLQMLLYSASSRLKQWASGQPLKKMCPSHLREHVAYHVEQRELAEIEQSMTREERFFYDHLCPSGVDIYS